MSFFSVFIFVIGALISIAWYIGDSPQFFERSILGVNTFFSDEEESEYTYAVSPDVVFSLSNINGSITVMGHNKNEIKLLITKKGKKEHFEYITQKIINTPESVSVKTIYNTHHNESKVWVIYQVFVPHTAHLRSIQNINGSIEISSVHNDIIVKNVNGSITIDESYNSIEAQTTNGKITLTIQELAEDKTISLSSLNGQLKCFIPENFSAHINAQTFVGKIFSDFNFSNYNKKFTGNHAIGTIGTDKGGSITMKVNNGTIHIHENHK